MSILTFLLHILLDFLLGKGLLDLAGEREMSLSNSILAILLGFFVETSFSFLMLWLGLPIHVTLNILIVLVIGIAILQFFQWRKVAKSNSINLGISLSGFKQFKWYEWLLLLLILEKFYLIIWQFARTPAFHSDTIRHWSTQARALYSGLNFSMNPESFTLFLGRRLGIITEYPLQGPIWRAHSAFMNGGWDSFIARNDSLLFFVIILTLVATTIWSLTKKRWITIGFIYIIASIPLHVWHGAAGYTDIMLEAFLLATIISFINKKWLLVGLFMSGVIWSKNDGLAIYLPGILLAGLVYHLFDKKIVFKQKITSISAFLLGISTIIPWLIFQALYCKSVFSRVIKPIFGAVNNHFSEEDDFEVILTQVGPRFQDATPSYQLFWDYVLTGSTFGIFWIIIFVSIFLLTKNLLADSVGRSLLIFFLTTCILIYYVYTYTPAYEFLLIQTTVHRTLLQFAASALIIVGYGVSLRLKEEIKQNVAPLIADTTHLKKKKNRKK